MINSAFVNVAVTLPVMQEFTYAVPEKFKALCQPGMRVLVPFGGRRVTGYILSEKESYEGKGIKNILEVPDDHPMFPQTQIPFFKWISRYYLYPIGEVIKAALPSGLNQKDVSCVFVTEKGRDKFHKKDLSEQADQIIGFIQSKKTVCALSALKKQFPRIGLSVLQKMEKDDLIGISAVLKKDGAGIKLEKYLSLGDPGSKKLVMSKKRQKILGIIREKKEISLTGLKSEVPTAPALIKPLAEAGYIKINERRVFRDPLGDPVEPDTPPKLTGLQKKVVQKVIDHLEQGFCPYLLHGVTGSGKTEVYMRLVQETLEKEKNAVVLVPEISLISQTERRFRARFGDKIAVIHSALTPGELVDQWRKIILNKARIVIGARSALFAPFENVGMVIVDEEHDGSYKQETGLRYNARDLAVVRASHHQCPVILGSATPSVQSYQNVIAEKFVLLTLDKRVGRHPLPDITLVDLKAAKDIKGNDRIISPQLAREIRKCLNKGNQALVFLNRRGFATYPVCRDCGETLSCKHCDVTLTLHKTVNEYRCHLCGFSKKMGVRCPKCGSDQIRPLGFGTQKVEGMLKEMFPDARVARMDQDTTSKKGSLIKILKDIRNRNVDIVVGTQMLAKGHDFPAITLVGIVCADLSLSLPDFRAGERTFQLLAQVAGRAGRGDEKGKVIMQTYNPDHFIIEASKEQDFLTFFNNEVPFRKALMYPPFSRMIQIKISGADSKKVALFANKVFRVLQAYLSKLEDAQRQMVQILGPIEAPIYRISARFRWQMLVKCVSAGLINRMAADMLVHPELLSRSGISLAVDVDPYFLM